MPTCKDCKFFEPSVDNPIKGFCFGHEVDADKNVDDCPANAYQPKEEQVERE